MGKCKYCDNLTHTRCDNCNAYVCKEHAHYVNAPNSISKRFVLCKECMDKKKKPVNSTRVNHNAGDF
ncbi:hypothetical protein JXB31_05865 [Candidatus Woesearchaeota archaeon]|nr:hypothetical protein [Candidatus Woesearchaeota archaeon]